MNRSNNTSKPPRLRPALGRLLAQLSKKRRSQLLLVSGLMMLSSLAEMLSLGAVVPWQLWLNLSGFGTPTKPRRWLLSKAATRRSRVAAVLDLVAAALLLVGCACWRYVARLPWPTASARI